MFLLTTKETPTFLGSGRKLLVRTQGLVSGRDSGLLLPDPKSPLKSSLLLFSWLLRHRATSQLKL